MRSLALIVCAGLILASELAAHEQNSNSDQGDPSPPPTRPGLGVAVGQSPSPPGFVLPQKPGPRPWTTKPVLNGSRRFQIAIVTDRTGGHRPGVWLDAMQKLNLMRPEFVVSVGDLIEGYSEDRRQLEREWAEFLRLTNTLDMRFFFVPGNHDVINPVQHEMWKAKFGDEWYSFDYRDVHFVCLNSEDTRNQIGDEQLKWLEQDLAKHNDARWTLVFIHKPLWTYSERAIAAGNTDNTNWPAAQKLLADRPHTIFSGHVHNYTQYVRNGGYQYFSLATTGGGSRLRGEPYGEFDHVMWLTMEPEGPHLAVLKLDGIVSPDVVTEQSAKRFRHFLQTARVEVEPIFMASGESGFGEGELLVRLVNEFGENLTASCEINGLPLKGLTVEPQQLLLTVGPTGVAKKKVDLKFADPVAFHSLRYATMKATVSTGGDNPLRAERIVPVVIDRRQSCPRIASAPQIDGVVEPWSGEHYDTAPSPELLGAIKSWQGPADGSFLFHVLHDDEFIYLSAEVTDEQVVPGDRLEFLFDGRRFARRREDSRMRWDTCRATGTAPVAGSRASRVVWSGRQRRPVKGAKVATAPSENGYSVEVALPISEVTRRQRDGWESFQLAAVLHDIDETGGEETQVLWRGSPEVFRNNNGYGYFLKASEN